MKQTYSDFSPISIFDPAEDFGTDFTSDSAASPLSPLSPALSASSFGFPATDGWTAWDRTELSPEPENLFTCQPFDCSPQNPSMSPAINPMDLTMPINSQSSLFQNPQVMLATIPTQQQQPMAASLPTPPTPSTTSCANNATSKRYPSRGLKRKSSSSTPEDEPTLPAAKIPSTTTPTTPAARRHSTGTKPNKDTVLGPKKTAHNMIEKRYRTNLNDKITQLRDAVPSLRTMTQQRPKLEVGLEFDDAEENDAMMEQQQQQQGAFAAGAKLNKATILSKATEYILQLERRNHGLETENSALRGRMEGLEMMLMSRGGMPVAGVWN